MKLDKISQNLLEKIANIHALPDGAVSFRKNGKGEFVRSTPNIEIMKKGDGSGIDIFGYIYSFLYGIPVERLPERVAD